MNHAYTAGLIDGEGTIGISRTNAGTYAIRVAVAITDVASNIIHNLHRTYSGRVNPMKPGGEKHRPKLRWSVEGEKAAAVLESVLPHLILKREQARIALDLQDHVRQWRQESGRHFWSHSRQHAAEVLKQRINELNQRGMQKAEPAPLAGRKLIAVARWGGWWQGQEDLFGPVPFEGKFPASGSMRHGKVYEAPMAPLPGPDLPGRLLPTPMTGDASGTRNATAGRTDPNSQHHNAWTLSDVVFSGQLLPTPTARLGDSTNRGADPARYKGPKSLNGRRSNLDDCIAAVETKAPWLGGSSSPPSDAGSTSSDDEPRHQLTIWDV